MSVIKAGLIGSPLGHSMSPYIHERIMEASGISGRYELYEISSEELPKYAPILMKELTGFNITIPHKVAILPFLDDVAPMVKEYGAANTVCGKIGYNTDVDGFLSCEIPLSSRKVLLLGAGGVARMMAIEALKAGADLTIWARSVEKAEVLVKECKEKGFEKVRAVSDDEIGKETSGTGAFDTVLNGTPCGMWPDVHGLAPHLSALKKDGTFFDTIYNPCPTKSCMQVRSHGGTAVSGLKMLLNQAIAAEKIWAPDAHFDDGRLAEILPDVRRKLWEKNPVKIVFTGFMGAGKTYIGRKLSEDMKIPFLDLDERIETIAGCPITEIFKKDGEETFRRMEHDVLKVVLEASGAEVISLGGGVLTNPENVKLLKESKALVIYLQADADTIWERVKDDTTRPLLQASDKDTAYRNMCERLAGREASYLAGSDVTVSACGDKEVVYDRVKNLFIP
jgi:shikimate dehydrogenase